MDTAMRDLDQLRERGDETTGRKIGLFAMAGVLSVSAVFAMGIVIGRGDSKDDGPSVDPLAQLALPPAKAKANEAAVKPVDVKPESLSFPTTLVDRDDSLVEATIRAAEAEHAALTGQPAVPSLPARIATPSVPLPPPLPSDLPAASLASEENARLERVAKHDPLVARALPTEPAAETAPQGYEGAYVLQVVSYERSEHADKFAKALRARGHKAFVMSADVPGRGRYFRVRVGPFDTRGEAAKYQDKFESEERMNTILVSNTGK